MSLMHCLFSPFFPCRFIVALLFFVDLRRDRYQNNFFGFPSPAFGFGFGLSPLAGFHTADRMLDNHGFSAFTASTTNFESFNDTPAIRRITTTTKVVNGKKVSTKK